MRGRTVTLLLIALVMGGGAAWVANSWIMDKVLPDEGLKSSASVVVAAVEIAYGQKLAKDHVKVLFVPKELAQQDVFGSVDEVIGMVATQKISQGEMLYKSRFLAHLRGSTLATMLKPDMRAVTIRVNDVIGVAGFLLPGNTVDVLSGKKVSGGVRTRTLLQDITVLAVDQTAAQEKDQPVVVRAVTLEVSQKEAEILFRAREEGPIQLALRNPMDSGEHVKRIVEQNRPKPRVRTPAPSKPVKRVEIIRESSVKRTIVDE